MGGSVLGAGTSTIVIEGVEKLGAVEHAVVPDRIGSSGRISQQLVSLEVKSI